MQLDPLKLSYHYTVVARICKSTGLPSFASISGFAMVVQDTTQEGKTVMGQCYEECRKYLIV